jgi:outer membrane protein assembly factor BamA
MSKLKLLFTALILLTNFLSGRGQEYRVHYIRTDGDSSTHALHEWLQTVFPSRDEAGLYLVQIPTLLHTRGFIAASVDQSILDSASARVSVYLGPQYKWTRIHTRPQDAPLLTAIRWPEDKLNTAPDYDLLHTWQQKILDHLEETGYPFGSVSLDSIQLEEDGMRALLHIDRGPLYRIDSIRVYGDARVNNEFLQRYLDIANGSTYNKKKLEAISRKLAEISYLQEERSSDLTLLGTGSVLNLYLKARKSSQANILIGFQPNSDQLTSGKKLLLTVDANVLLRNALGSGETIGLVWQQLLQRSPRLNLLYEQPYIFRSPLGLNFSLDMYKRDSLFLNINMNLGTNYRLDEFRTASVFLQRRQTIVSGINTNLVIQSRRLPREADVQSLNLGFGFTLNKTDYRFNPTKGREFQIQASAGTKKIRRNNLVVELKDPSEPSFDFGSLYDTVKLKAYQFRIIASGAQFIPLGGQSTLRLGVNAGIYQSANYFRNELFQIGGYRLMRGFDEESQFVSQYTLGSLEYRLRLSTNSYFFGFVDGGWGKHLLELQRNHSYFGTGLGLSFETKAGIINLAWAIGKRDDTELNLRQSKVHLGFASYF